MMTPTPEQIEAEVDKALSILKNRNRLYARIAKEIARARLEAREQALDYALAIIDKWEGDESLVYRLVKELKEP